VGNEINCILDIVVKAINWPKRFGFYGFDYLGKNYCSLWNLRKSLKSKWYRASIWQAKSILQFLLKFLFYFLNRAKRKKFNFRSSNKYYVLGLKIV